MPTAVTYSPQEAAHLLGISKTAVYSLIKNDEFPTPVLRLGGRYVILRAPLDELLLLDTPINEAA